MKKIVMSALLCAMMAPLFVSCHMLDEKNYGNPTTDDMLAKEDNIVLLVGQAYADVKWLHDHWGYWGVASLTADECICPVRVPGEHWSDGGYWKNLNTHNWNEFGDAFKNIWNTTIQGAVLCNKLLDALETNKANMSEDFYYQYTAELKVLRSYYYYMLFDCFGRIPYLEVYEDVTEPLMEPQAVWAHLIACLEENAVNLPIVTDGNRAAFYGRCTQGMAYALLARLYLNAESFGCTAANVNAVKRSGDAAKSVLEEAGIVINSEADFYTHAVRCCDNIIESKSYEIDPDFFANFAIKNENSKENIFVIVEDGNADFDYRDYAGSMANKLRITMLTLHYCHQTTWDLIEKPWNGFCARPSFLERYNERDVRGPGNEGKGTLNEKRWGWFVGPIYDAKGDSILRDENDTVAIIRPEIESLDKATWNDGARLFKYEIDKTKTYKYCENDFVLFRFADVLWMKEEAILRGGAGISGASSDEFQKMLKRAFAYEADPLAAYKAAYPTATSDLNSILDERGREFAWENIRRRDLIRFDKYSDPTYVEYVSATDPYRKWFPIPYSVLEKGKRDEQGKPIWTQNEGY